MTSRDKNQNDIINSELINSYNIDYVFSDRPINRFKTKPLVEDISNKLNDLITEIQNIQNCELKNSANKLVFNDGNNLSKIMISIEQIAHVVRNYCCSFFSEVQ